MNPVKLVCPDNPVAMMPDQLPVLASAAYHYAPFHEETIGFLDAYSKQILADKSINKLPEIAALGFWLRKSNINQLKSENQHLFSNSRVITSPLGKVLHICPANVDTMFMYSLAVSLLMGNKNIVRISSRMDAPHVQVLFSILNKVLADEKFSAFSSYVNLVSYERNDEISSFFSQSCNARVIWGGDQTVLSFKKLTSAPRTKDIVFADRVSVCCLNADAFLNLENNEKENALFLKNFFNDAYTFDQMGCSSPQTLFVIGNAETAKACIQHLQASLAGYLKTNYHTDVASLASLKLNRSVDDALDGNVKNKTGNNYITFLELDEKADVSSLHGCGGGYFYYKHIESTDELLQLQRSKLQTITYYGLDEAQLAGLRNLANGEGIDRIVPLGTALSFNYIWDGYNLFDELSKKLYIA